ncbi:MAG: hypothetical protein Q7T51_04355 [Candidatus Moranbacteria bacterium]|nr:hypothetical protein [Candidatus Moranbacteria bacterium]
MTGVKQQPVEFGDPEGFLAWFAQGGKVVKIDLGPKNWALQVGPRLEDTKFLSPFYNCAIESRPPYGAWKVCGFKLPFGGELVCGVVNFAFDASNKPVMSSRRRTTENDALPDGHMIVGVIEATPDRVEEPSAVTISVADTEKFKKLKADEWLELYDTVRDGVEREAVMALRRWLKAN